jgi:pimeloyl-ACP methyl ester carboxylesterase
VAAVVGHDFGSPVAAYCALIRPDLLRSVVLMSAPFAGPPSLSATEGASDIDADLAALDPPRKHYHQYYSTPGADADIRHAPQGIHAFLRAYYHVKSGDWQANAPHPLEAWTAEDLARLPTYYIMERDKGMAATVAPHMPTDETIAACRWLTESELRIYSENFNNTGFQGGLNWYRCTTDPALAAELALFAGRTIDVPACFIAGKSDWGIFQRPGALEAMRTTACTQYQGTHLIDGAGHWVQQEQPKEVADMLLAFLRQQQED